MSKQYCVLSLFHFLHVAACITSPCLTVSTLFNLFKCMQAHAESGREREHNIVVHKDVKIILCSFSLLVSACAYIHHLTSFNCHPTLCNYVHDLTLCHDICHLSLYQMGKQMLSDWSNEFYDPSARNSFHIRVAQLPEC